MEQEFLLERMALAEERIGQIPEETSVGAPYDVYFQRVSRFITRMFALYRETEPDRLSGLDLEGLKARNRELYSDVLADAYEHSFANPAYATAALGEEFGCILSFLYTEIRGMIGLAFDRRTEEFVSLAEVFIEVYNLFEHREESADLYREVKDTLYYYISDNCDITVDYRTEQVLTPGTGVFYQTVMESDLKDLRYLYGFGEFISESELDTAAFLNTLPKETITSMAATCVSGFQKGFELAGKPLDAKKTVEIRYTLGFERVVRETILQFERLGLQAVLYRPAVHLINKRQNYRIGCVGTPANRQFEYDHRFDLGLFFDGALKERRVSVLRQSYEKRKELASAMAGPALVETFGEKQFYPVNKPEVCSLSEKQQKLMAQMQGETTVMVNEYIPGEERSFTIISYPIPEIGPHFEEIFRETIRLNTLDYEIYKEIQTKLIDALDGCCEVKVKGRAGNRTDLTVRLHELTDGEKESNFENCLADVNIPLGEVFTSPVLKGTCGVLHVQEVYIHELRYENLEFSLKDGMVTDYGCTNFEEVSQNRAFVRETILNNYETLPIGEFAIGTNTVAYKMAKDYDIFDKLKILIAEKTGPHFAFGDTCYSHSEDMKVYNPDGKEIIARDNEISILRREDPMKAYYGCHTDVTLPYDELGEITGVRQDGSEIVLYQNGRFVLPGCEELNKALNTLTDK